jgi:hypothetical protein
MSSIILEPGVKEMLLADCRDFLQSEDWYVYYLQFARTCGYMRSIGTLKEVCSESLNPVGFNDAEIYGPVFGQGCPFDVDTCCTVYREGTLHPHPPRNEGHSGYVLTFLSGKTSLILSLAGALGLDIYTVSLSSKGRRMNYSTLMALMANISTP